MDKMNAASPPPLTAEYVRRKIAEAQAEQREHLDQANALSGVVHALQDILPMVEATEMLVGEVSVRLAGINDRIEQVETAVREGNKE